MRFLPVIAIAALVPALTAAAVPVQSGKTLPAKFHGEWARTQADCMSKGGENSQGFRVTATTITYYESTEKVQQVRVISPTSVHYTAQMESAEGDEASQGDLKLSADGQRLLGKTRGEDLVRCVK
jgi:hypothetical protein